ncbi:MAG: DUF1549 domain-containing protein [Planctomycetaceae bacterium]|nr:DUF1549 domain-containing protein [Planctomycetales bacterium]MCB9923457.1 DUF1549 domain-containing protein [Planctomycetaceae bacterium]
MRRVARLLFVVPMLLLGSPGNSSEVDFSHDIVPILRTHCVKCHSGDKRQGGLSLDTRELLLAGGESGAVVEPRASSRSPLFERVTTTDSDLRMPPEGNPVPPEQVEKLKQWIDTGLAWEPGFSLSRPSYEPPLAHRMPTLPPAIDGREHPIDRIVDQYFAHNNIARPGPVSDKMFLRRVSLDLIGLLPDPNTYGDFVVDTDADKRSALVKSLLANDVAYAEHWLTFWNDLLRNDYTGTGFITGGRKQITGWLYDALLHNKPYDQFTRELIAPQTEAIGFISGIRWRGNVSASQMQEIQFAQNVSQAFLGINMKCASCHDSFIDRWTLEETYGLAAIYATDPLMLHRCDKPIDKTATPAWIFPELGQIDAEAPRPERLKQLAALLTHADNGRFARTIVNRIWNQLMGHGIVHPVDAMHTEPWSTDLLDYLAIHLRDNGFDLKQTIELICSSQIYQSQTPPVDQPQDAGRYVFRGPQARRMTAEQFVDAVWQITDAAPVNYDAQVLRFKHRLNESSQPLTAKWIWSHATASEQAPAGETITLRHKFELPSLPVRAVAVMSCDNSYRMFLNGKPVTSDENWETVEAVSILSQLRRGDNVLLLEAKNGGNTPNPAGLIFEATLRFDDGSTHTIASDESWDWTIEKLNARGSWKSEPDDWKPAAAVLNPSVWSGRVGSAIVGLLNAATDAPLMMVRASLVKSDGLMRALGRPNRDQIVTSRPSELTTLEAIDLANGQTLLNAIQQGARHFLADHGGSGGELMTWLCQYAFSREPTSDELKLAREFLGQDFTQQAVEDLLWSVLMLPEFQLVR